MPSAAASWAGRGASVLPPLHQLCQKSPNVYTAWLASELAREVHAGWNWRPCWGSETKSDEAFSCLPTRLPRPGLMQPGLGQRRAGKAWGYWPRPLLPWPKPVIHSQQGPGAWHSGRPALISLGMSAFLGPAFEMAALSSTEGRDLLCFLGSGKFLSFQCLFCVCW